MSINYITQIFKLVGRTWYSLCHFQNTILILLCIGIFCLQRVSMSTQKTKQYDYSMFHKAVSSILD